MPKCLKISQIVSFLFHLKHVVIHFVPHILKKEQLRQKKNPSNWLRPPVFYLQIIAKKGEKNTKNCL